MFTTSPNIAFTTYPTTVMDATMSNTAPNVQGRLSGREPIAMNTTTDPTAEASAAVNLARDTRVEVGKIHVDVNIVVNACAPAV